MVQDWDHAGCGPNVRLNDWLGRTRRNQMPNAGYGPELAALLRNAMWMAIAEMGMKTATVVAV